MLGTGFGGGGGPNEPPHPAKAATSNKTLGQCQMQPIRLSFRMFPPTASDFSVSLTRKCHAAPDFGAVLLLIVRHQRLRALQLRSLRMLAITAILQQLTGIAIRLCCRRLFSLRSRCQFNWPRRTSQTPHPNCRVRFDDEGGRDHWKHVSDENTCQLACLTKYRHFTQNPALRLKACNGLISSTTRYFPLGECR